ncbi:MAG TPA: nucleoside transporter C-terminal domain-containing protein [Candidatus Acidoferrales bacterium]|nr:nucleoside transporter C-terminal domain-containing protein [Candidatus Acidoferrales bacterium]
MERLMGLLGIVTMLGIAYLLSTNRRAIRVKTVAVGLVLQFVFALFVLRTEIGVQLFRTLGALVTDFLHLSRAGSEFVFGQLGWSGSEFGKTYGIVFAFDVLPTIIFVAAFFAVLYYYGIMQKVIKAFAWLMSRLMDASGAESVTVAASVFGMGQTEAPLSIRPYISKLTMSEMMTIMTSGMAHIAGGVMAAYIAFGAEARHLLTAVVMTAPGTIMLAKMFVPETESPVTAGVVKVEVERTDPNVLGATARGTTDGLHLALNVAAMLISFLALIAFVNWVLAGLHNLAWFFPGSLQQILGWVFSPIAWLLGVPWGEATTVGNLLGLRMVANEFIAFGELGKVIDAGQLSPRSITIATFALCGFANLSSIGIQIGGIGALAPERRGDLARLGFRAMLAGTMANFISAAIAGILL